MMLICGLYAPSAGCVTWDGVDVESLDPVQLRAAIAPMFQDYTRYRLTARENIAVSDLSAEGDQPRARSLASTKWSIAFCGQVLSVIFGGDLFWGRTNAQCS